MKFRAWSHIAHRLSCWLGSGWPASCCICAQICSAQLDLCGHCRAHFPNLSRFAVNPDGARDYATLCSRCGQCWPEPGPIFCCRYCVNIMSSFAHIVVPYQYVYPMDNILHQLKYQGKRQYARILGILLAEEVRQQVTPFPDCILPVPQHGARLRDRGFNHAADIGYWCARELGVSLRPDWVAREFDTNSLAGLSRAERSLEIRGAFSASPNVKNKRVAIVDDVLTTGATAGELARELIDTGAGAVDLWVVARTPAPGTFEPGNKVSPAFMQASHLRSTFDEPRPAELHH